MYRVSPPAGLFVACELRFFTKNCNCVGLACGAGNVGLRVDCMGFDRINLGAIYGNDTCLLLLTL